MFNYATVLQFSQRSSVSETMKAHVDTLLERKELQLIGSIVLIVASLLLVIITSSIMRKQKK